MGMDIVKPLGKFKEVDLGSDVGRMIILYALSSINIPHGSGMKLSVLRIMKKDSSGILPFLGTSQHHVKLSQNSRAKNQKGKSPKNFSMLLWYKTSPKSIDHLASGRDSCVAFYDRLCRALPKPVDKFLGNERLVLLLCRVITITGCGLHSHTWNTRFTHL